MPSVRKSTKAAAAVLVLATLVPGFGSEPRPGPMIDAHLFIGNVVVGVAQGLRAGHQLESTLDTHARDVAADPDFRPIPIVQDMARDQALSGRWSNSALQGFISAWHMPIADLSDQITDLSAHPLTMDRQAGFYGHLRSLDPGLDQVVAHYQAAALTDAISLDLKTRKAFSEMPLIAFDQFGQDPYRLAVSIVNRENMIRPDHLDDRYETPRWIYDSALGRTEKTTPAFDPFAAESRVSYQVNGHHTTRVFAGHPRAPEGFSETEDTDPFQSVSPSEARAAAETVTQDTAPSPILLRPERAFSDQDPIETATLP